MRNFLRSRRGSVAFATVVALVPVVGAIALGAEAGSWYVTKQQAQNAADAAAISGALRVACDRGSIACADLNSVDYRGKQFAAQNAFCNAGDNTVYSGAPACPTLPTGVSRSVTITQPTPVRVQATVGQQQPAYLAKLLGLSTINIGATAIAEIWNPTLVCALGLGKYPKGSALTIGGNVTNAGEGCGLMSNDTVKFNSDPNFTGTGWSVNASEGCLPGGNQCNDPGVPHNYFLSAAINPLEALDNAPFNSWTGKTSKPSCNGTLTPNNSSNLYGDLTCTNGDTLTLSAGTYFFYNAAIKINGGTVTGAGVTLVLLGDSSLSITGGTVNLSAPEINTFSSLLNGVLIDDQAPNKSKNAVNVNGGGTVKLGGALYFPNVDVSWSGTTQSTSTACTQVIANTLTMTGNAYLSSQGCTPNTVSKTQVVALVQ